MFRTMILTLGIGAALAATSGTASAQFFAPPAYNPYSYSTVVPSSYYYSPSTTVVTPFGGIVSTPVYSSYYAPRVVYPNRVYRSGFYGYGYRAPVYRGGWGYRGWRR